MNANKTVKPFCWRLVAIVKPSSLLIPAPRPRLFHSRSFAANLYVCLLIRSHIGARALYRRADSAEATGERAGLRGITQTPPHHQATQYQRECRQRPTCGLGNLRPDR